MHDKMNIYIFHYRELISRTWLWVNSARSLGCGRIKTVENKINFISLRFLVNNSWKKVLCKYDLSQIVHCFNIFLVLELGKSYSKPVTQIV